MGYSAEPVYTLFGFRYGSKLRNFTKNCNWKGKQMITQIWYAFRDSYQDKFEFLKDSKLRSFCGFDIVYNIMEPDYANAKVFIGLDMRKLEQQESENGISLSLSMFPKSWEGIAKHFAAFVLKYGPSFDERPAGEYEYYSGCEDDESEAEDKASSHKRAKVAYEMISDKEASDLIKEHKIELPDKLKVYQTIKAG